MEWNDLRDEVAAALAAMTIPDLSDQSWTVMKFREYEDEKGKLEWLIRKEGCMHCSDPGCLKACPSPGAIISTLTASSTSRKRTASAAATATGCPRRAAHLQEGPQGLQVHAVLGPGCGGQEPACEDLPDRRSPSAASRR